MKVWIDVFSGDEMVSDSYNQCMLHNDACLEVQAKYITKGNEKIDIGGDEEDEDLGDGETVINVVDAHQL